MESQALLSLTNTMMEKWWKQSEKQNISLKKLYLYTCSCQENLK